MGPLSFLFCGDTDSDGHLFWECTFPPLVEFVNILSFMILWRWIRLIGPGVFFGMVGCLFSLESMGVPLRLRALGKVLVIFLSVLVPDHPIVWSDASHVLDQVTGVSGAVFFLLASLWTFGMIGGGVMLIMFALRLMFSPVEVSVLFLGLSSLSKERRCGVSFWLCSLLVLFTWC